MLDGPTPGDRQSPRSPESGGLLPPRFGLGAAFGSLTALCGLFALFALLDPRWSMGITLLLLLGAGHVAGGALGTELRERATARMAARPPRSKPPAVAGPQARVGRAGTTSGQLREKKPLGRMMFACAGGGAAMLGLPGGLVLAAIQGGRATWPGILIGCLSCAVLGAWFGFLASSFWEVSRGALREAAQPPSGPAG